MLTVTTQAGVEEDKVKSLVHSMTPNAKLTYALAGTQKFELPTADVSLASIFETIGGAEKNGVSIRDWGISNATLEEVFIAFAKERGVEGGS